MLIPPSRRWLTALVCVLLCVEANAQPEVTLEFSGLFGRLNTYRPCRPEDLQGSFCPLPPNQYPPEGFLRPSGIDWFPDGQRLAVADYGNRKLQRCTPAGECFWIGGDGQGGQDSRVSRNVAGTFDKPHGVEVNLAGRIAVADEDNHAVQYCSDTGGCFYKGDDDTGNNEPRTALGFWAFPGDVAFLSNGDILGLDTGNNRIQRLRYPDWFTLRTYANIGGTGPGDTDGPAGIAVDLDDRVIIADTMNDRILVCHIVGINLECDPFGASGDQPGQFNRPVGIDVDPLGRIWVADTGNHRIQACDDQGQCVAFGEFGDFEATSDTSEGDNAEGPGRFNAPRDIAYHPTGWLAVADTDNNRVQLFTTEPAFTLNPGMNDAWLNPEVFGQGVFITAWPGLGLISLAHFTFDAQPPDPAALAIVGGPGQRWVTALGAFEGSRGLLRAQLTAGGVFDAESPAPQQQSGYGEYRIRFFNDCQTAELTVDFPGLDLSGEMNLVRALPDNGALCKALQPTP